MQGLISWSILQNKISELGLINVFIYTESLGPVPDSVQASSHNSDAETDMVKVLQEIFPDKQYNELFSVSSRSATLQEAIDKLLDTQGTIDNGKDIHM